MTLPTITTAALIAVLAASASAQAQVAKPASKPSGQIGAVAYRPDGKLLAAGGRGEVLLVHGADGKPAGKVEKLSGQVTALAWSKDGARLAVGVSTPGRAGELRLYEVPAAGFAKDAKAAKTLKAHKDSIHAAVFSPDGKTLATAGYDRMVKLFSAAGEPLHTLTDHSDSVYSLSFSPDGALLATGAADRTVKIWRVADGVRLFTLSEPTDWVYAVAWSPAGPFVAAGGVDKSIRVWRVDAAGGKLEHSVFAHEGAVLALAWSADGKTLASVGEDRVVKVYDAATLAERRILDKQPENSPALALSADGRRIAVGRFDGSVGVFDAATGKRLFEPLPVRVETAMMPNPRMPAPAVPAPPTLTAVRPGGVTVGATARVEFEGKSLESATAVVGLPAGASAKVVSARAGLVVAEIAIPASATAGVYKAGLKTARGNTTTLTFAVDPFPGVAEREPNDSRGAAQALLLPATVAGAIGRTGDIDHFVFELKAGAELGVELLAAELGAKLTAVISLLDADGRVVAEGGGSLGFVCDKPGAYVLRVRDAEYRGGPDFVYRLSAGDLPVMTDVFPPGLARGGAGDVQVRGANLGGVKSVRVSVPADAAVGSRVPVTVKVGERRVLGGKSVIVGEFPEALEREPNDAPAAATAMPVPGVAQGRIDRPGDFDVYRFAAKKGSPLIVEVQAARLGSPVDSLIEILDAKGAAVGRAVLRCRAVTYTVFRDHDSGNTGMRIENWSELAMNDFVFVGTELLRIRALPRNPDDDMQFFARAGRRTGQLDTTPVFQSPGTPIYKVDIHPAGSNFPPNGMPIFRLNYVNDDGGAGSGKDSRLTFDPPADGDWFVRISDVHGHGGPGHSYRLTVRPPRPDFTISASPANPKVYKGGAVPITVNIERADGFDGTVEFKFENVPTGFSAPAANIPGLDLSTALALYAQPDAAVPPAGAPPMKLVARATIGGREVVREASLGNPGLIEPGDVVTFAELSEVTLTPGGTVNLPVRIERRNKFAGRVPIEVRGLPHGVRVLDIGLNGILITERETARVIQLYAEPWVEPIAHPFVVLAKLEGKNTEHAAKSVLLRVTAGAAAGKN